jgi:thioredoxin 1
MNANTSKIFGEIEQTLIDVDSEGELARRFEVRSIPTFILIEDGQEVNRFTGAKTRKDLENFIK